MRSILFVVAILGSMMVNQVCGATDNDVSVSSASCALAVFTALQQLSREPFLGEKGKTLHEYLVGDFKEVRCELKKDEIHVTLISKYSRGGNIFYRIGVDKLDIRETRFER